MNLLQFPLVKVAIGFIIGLLVAFHFNPTFELGIGLVLSAFLLFLLSRFWVKNRLYFSLSVYVFSFCWGMFTQTLHNDLLFKQHYLYHLTNEKQVINLTLDTKLKPNTINYRYYAKVNSIDNTESTGTILVNISKKLYSEEPEIGAKFDIYSKVIPHSAPKNPGQFDYGKYLEKQKVYAQVYADTNNIRKLGTQKTLNYYTYKIRNRILTNLEKSGFNKEELAVLHALILGQQQDISPDILQAYQYAGAVHILSVSGLHVAYIYLFLNFILKFIPNHRKGKLFKLFILFLSLWGFALLAGMSPAIVRAVTMFSFVSLGAYLNRNTNIFYTLVISMLFILLGNPSFLFDVGFQLSYLALFFIVWAKPMIDKLYVPGNKIAKYIWDVVAVSLTAQIGVLPLSLYYFHQFPTLFIITNLLVLFPLSGFMIYGVIISVLALLGFANFYLSKIMEYGIWYINQVTFQVAKLEKFVFTDVSFTFYMLVGWYIIIFSLFALLQSKKFNRLIAVLTGVLFLQIAHIFFKVDAKKSNEFIVFNKNRSTLLSDKKADKITFFTNDSITQDDYLIKSYKLGNPFQTIKIDSLRNFYFTGNKKIMLIDKSAIFNDSLTPDVILLTGSPKINLERFLEHHKPEVVIADASNYKSYVQLWKQTCEKYKIRLHSTYENGFYKIEY